MIEATTSGFEVREGRGIIFAGHVSPSQFINDRVNEGDQVTLKKNGRKILVNQVRYDGAGLIGIVYGFEPPGVEIEFEGIRLGDEIFFFDYHIFSCGRNS